MTNTIGRIVVGFVSDLPAVDPIVVACSALIVGGVATCFLPFISGMVWLVIYALIFGLAICKCFAEMCSALELGSIRSNTTRSSLLPDKSSRIRQSGLKLLPFLARISELWHDLGSKSASVSTLNVNPVVCKMSGANVEKFELNSFSHSPIQRTSNVLPVFSTPGG